MDNETLRDVLSEAIMFATRGYKNRTDFPREWDADNPDSQFAMVLEDVDIAIARLHDLGLLPTKSDNLHVQATSMTGSVYPPTVSFTGNSATTSVTFPAPTTLTPSRGVKKTVSITVELPAGSTLEQLEEYTETLKALEVSPDDVVTSSGMKYVINLMDCGVERIDCGECGYKDYIVFPSDHSCVLD